MTGAVYVDSSALARLLLEEPEGDTLREYLAGFRRQATSVVARVEVGRAIWRRAPDRLAEVRPLLDDLTTLELTTAVTEAAAVIEPATLRTLDAIHLASAAELGEDLEAIVTYDRRLATAARALGLPVASPGA